MQERLFYQAASSFEAARRIDQLPLGHPARGLHGHGFKVRVMAELPPGWGGFDGAETDALADALCRSVEPLDYADLNRQLQVPSDANLAAWVSRRLERQQRVPGIAQVGIQSTGEQGVELRFAAAEQRSSAALCQAHVWRRFRFEAAHLLPRVPADHPCGRMHGHGFEVILHLEQGLALEPSALGSDGLTEGMAEDLADGLPLEAPTHLDYDRIAAAWAPLHEALDHRCLNDLTGLENPTSELLADWIWRRLKPRLPPLSQVSVYETATAGCHYDGQDYRIWKELRFEGALRLSRAPGSDPRRRLHGHSYMLRLQLRAPLDAVLGWTIDYGDVKQLFKPVYAQLDHHELNGLIGLDEPNAAGLALWMRRAIAESLPAVDRLELSERPGRGVLLCWGPRQPWQGPAVLPLAS